MNIVKVNVSSVGRMWPGSTLQLPGGLLAGVEIGSSDGQAGSPAAQPFPRPRRLWLIGTRLRIGHYLPPGGRRMTTSQTDTNLA
jgi:hypothetical protein